MLKNLKISFSATSIIIGTIVGVGIFGLPYAIAKVGFLVGIPLLVLLSGAMLCLHYLYGEIVLRTKRKQRLVGYAKKYLGNKGKSIATLSAIFHRVRRCITVTKKKTCSRALTGSHSR